MVGAYTAPMGRIETSRRIAASAARVFEVIAHVENFREAVPEIVSVEFTTDTTRGAGTRFRETRRMGKREATVALEVVEYEPNERVRVVSDAGGTIWDTTFRVAAVAEGAVLAMEMEDRPHKLLARLLTPLIRPMVRRAVERDMDAVRRFCERGGERA